MQRHGDAASLLTTASTLQRFGPYDITDDPFLSGQSYWRKGVPRERVARSIRRSLRLSVHLTRVVTDSVTHAWLDDVFVLREHRGRGIAGARIGTALAHPAVADAALQLLLTADAHALYARHGVEPFPDAGALMGAASAACIRRVTGASLPLPRVTHPHG